MQVHILMFGDKIERASMDASKMYEAGKKMNGEDNPFGPYNVISMELDDAVLTSATHTDGMVIINCEPISKTGSNEYENVIVKNENGYPLGLIFMDLFYSEDDSRIYDKIRAGEKFQIKVGLVE